MDPTTTFCPNLACPARGHIGQDNIGIHSRKDKRFLFDGSYPAFRIDMQIWRPRQQRHTRDAGIVNQALKRWTILAVSVVGHGGRVPLEKRGMRIS